MISVTLGKPVKSRVYSELKKKEVSRTVEACKKCMLFKVTITNLSFANARHVVNDLLGQLSSVDASATLLSGLSWGQKAEYDEKKGMYIDNIVIDKDFDATEEQREYILSILRQQAKTLSYSQSFSRNYAHALACNL